MMNFAELQQLRTTLHSDISDVERWCFKDLEHCEITIEQETLWRTEVINITDPNATNAVPEPEPDTGEGDAAEGRRRRMADGDPLADEIDEQLSEEVMNIPSKMMNFVFKRMICALKIMDFVFKMADFGAGGGRGLQQ